MSVFFSANAPHYLGVIMHEGKPSCVIRAMPITDSEACRSPIPEHIDRGFRCMPIICIVEES